MSCNRKKCVKCGKSGHYAKCCRSSRRINYVAEEETYSEEEDDWTPEGIHSIKQKILLLSKNGKNGSPFYTATLLVNNRLIKFIIDTDSPVILIPKSKFNNPTILNLVTIDYRDVNDNRKKYEANTRTSVEKDGIKQLLELLITTKHLDTTGLNNREQHLNRTKSQQISTT